MFFLGSQLPVGKTVEFSVDLPQVGKVQVTGEIRYHHSYATEGVGMGIRFTRISQEHLTRVNRFVELKQD